MLSILYFKHVFGTWQSANHDKYLCLRSPKNSASLEGVSMPRDVLVLKQLSCHSNATRP
jgi:hypothetical protein